MKYILWKAIIINLYYSVSFMNMNDELVVDLELDLPKNEIFIFHEQTFNIPIVGIIFKIKGISSVVIHNNQIKISKLSSYSWKELKPLILAEINDYKNNISIDPFINQILDIIDEYINPALYDEGIYAEYIHHEENKIFIRINDSSSACNTCSTSSCNTCNVTDSKNNIEQVEKLFQHILNDNKIQIIQI